MRFLKSSGCKKTATWLAIVVLPAAVFVCLAPSVLAQASLGIELGQETGLGTADLKLIITRIIQIVLGFLGIIAVAIIIYGGYIWMSSEGNEEKISQAKRILVNAVIGLVIILASFGIVTYIIGRLQDATSGGGQGLPPDIRFSYNAGALGGGILQSVYPEPGARDVPRNTLVMVSFRESMDAGSIIDLDSHPQACQNAPEGAACGFLRTVGNQPTTRIINRTGGNIELAADRVIVMTADNRNFVFDPLEYLGSATSFTNYSVNLTDQINKSSGAPAFLIGGYLWSFEVSNLADLTPPRVTSVIPVSPPAVPKNTTVQINFNEAVNLVTATGQATGNPDEFFNTVLISYETADGNSVYLTGSASISNFFKTVEFISDAPCEVNGQPVQNSCGEAPTCFPGLENFIILVKAALVDEQGNTLDLFSGITDAAGNSLDGNGNGFAQGQPDDNYASNFSTTDQMDLTPPEVILPIEPVQSRNDIPRNQRLKATFNEYLLASSLSGNYRVFEEACGLEQPDWPENSACYPEGGFQAYLENINGDTQFNNGNPFSRAVLKTYYPHLDPLTGYNARLSSGIKDLYQNCYQPAAGPCAIGQSSPVCQ